MLYCYTSRWLFTLTGHKRSHDNCSSLGHPLCPSGSFRMLTMSLQSWAHTNLVWTHMWGAMRQYSSRGLIRSLCPVTELVQHTKRSVAQPGINVPKIRRVPKYACNANSFVVIVTFGCHVMVFRLFASRQNLCTSFASMNDDDEPPWL